MNSINKSNVISAAIRNVNTRNVWHIKKTCKKFLIYFGKYRYCTRTGCGYQSYATEALINRMDETVIKQIAHVAALPGIEKYALCMPDGHSGYGFPLKKSDNGWEAGVVLDV